MTLASILYPGDAIRLSTVIGVSAFIAAAVIRQARLPLLACLVWLLGFEGLFGLTVIALGRPSRYDVFHFVFYLVVLAVGPVWLWRRGLKPAWQVVAGAALVWLAWMVAGFHINAHSGVGFDPAAEVFNEAAKSLFAVAYLWPLLRPSADTLPKVDAERRARHATSADFRA